MNANKATPPNVNGEISSPVPPSSVAGATAELIELRLRAGRCAGAKARTRRAPVAEPPDTGPYPELLGMPAWRALPAAVRRRFAGNPDRAKPKHYEGHVVETRMSRGGKILAALARCLGAPLPTVAGGHGPASVIVAHDAVLGGQVWSRTYACAGQFPQVVNSVKRFQGPTGLEEYVGPLRRCGLGMTLDVSAPAGVLTFSSRRYFLDIFSIRIRLPALLTPGKLKITHQQLAGRAFRFTLSLAHPRLGELIHQEATFLDPLRNDRPAAE